MRIVCETVKYSLSYYIKKKGKKNKKRKGKRKEYVHTPQAEQNRN